jgi:hypothetical protein
VSFPSFFTNLTDTDAGVITGSVTWTLSPQAPSSCGDVRDRIIQEYVSFAPQVSFHPGAVSPTPQCSDFTQNASGDAQTAFYNFTDLNTSIDPSSGQSCTSYSWAAIRSPLVAAAQAGFGLDAWVLQLGGAPARPLNSVYRNPAHNFAPPNQCAGAGSTSARSRHMFGDAVDMRDIAGTACGGSKALPSQCPAGVQEWKILFKAAQRARAETKEGMNGPCGLGCVHADWRNKTGAWINP